MLGVTSCWNCQSSNLKPLKPEWEDPYGREHYTCRNCGQRVSITTLTLRESEGIKWIEGYEGEVLAFWCDFAANSTTTIGPRATYWRSRVFKRMTDIEKTLIAFRFEHPEGELERAGRLVIRRG